MSAKDSLVQFANEISLINGKGLLFHKKRFATLSNRVQSVVNVIKNGNNENQSLDLLLTTLEEIKDHMTKFTAKNALLAKHTVMYGSDEEQFIKWGERIQHCVDVLGYGTNLSGIFDGNVDFQDFNEDVIDLKAAVEEILITLFEDKDSKNVSKSIKDLKKEIEKMLAHQSEVRSTYQTKTAPSAALDISPDKIKYEKILGQGGFGVVWRARYKGELVAIKTIPKPSLTKQSAAALKVEANIMRRLAHPRVVGCFGIFEHDGNYCVVMELMEEGSLLDYLHEHNCPKGWIKREEIALDICSGMSYLHKLNVIHRDLKPGNIVLDKYLRAKITDFGLAVVKNTAVTSIKDYEMGTVQYMAPECFGLSPIFSPKSDVFAFGIILWELAHWTNAYKGVKIHEIRDSIRSGERLDLAPDLPILISQTIIQCWEDNPKARPEFKNVAKQMEADIILLQLSTPAIFHSDNLTKTISKINTSRSDPPFSSIVLTENNNSHFDAFSSAKDPLSGSASPGLANQDAKPKITEGLNSVGNRKRFNFQTLSAKKKCLLVLLGIVLLLVIAGIVVAIQVLIPNNSKSTNMMVTSSQSSAGTTTAKVFDFWFTEPYTSAVSSSQPLDQSTSTSPSSQSPNQSTSTSTSSMSTRTPAVCNYKNPIVSTFAGNNDNALFQSSFNDPYGISISSVGVFYISEQSGRYVRLIKSTGVSTLQIYNSNFDSNFGQYFQSLSQLAIDQNNGNIYLPYSGGGGSAILQISSTTIQLVAGSTSAIGSVDGVVGNSLLGASPNLVMTGSNLIVFDQNNHMIRILNTTNNNLTTIAGNGSSGYIDGSSDIARFKRPFGGAFDSFGNLYVSDSGNNAIRKITPTGVVSTFSTTSLSAPKGLIVDPCDNIIVISDSNSGLVRLYTQNNSQSLIAGSSSGYQDGNGVNARFRGTSNLAQDKKGSIYMTEIDNRDIRKIAFS